MPAVSLRLALRCIYFATKAIDCKVSEDQELKEA